MSSLQEGESAVSFEGVSLTEDEELSVLFINSFCELLSLGFDETCSCEESVFCEIVSLSVSFCE